MKLFFRLVAALLVMALLPVSGLAAILPESAQPKNPPLIFAPVFEDPDPPTALPQGAGEMSALQKLLTASDRIRQALLNGSSQVDISSLRVSTDDLQFRNVGYLCPYLDGDRVTFDGVYYSALTGTYSRIKLTNHMSKSEAAKWITRVDGELEKLNAVLDGADSLADQALALHDYMAAHYHYSTDYETNESAFYAGAILTEGSGVCQAYSYLYQYLFCKRGVECHTVTSDSMGHAWNLLAIGGNYYHIDTTWDDPVPDQFGMAKHDYFLLTDETVSDEYHRHYGWTMAELKATDPSFEDAYWVNVTSPIYQSGTLRYFCADNALRRYDTRTGQTESLHPLGRWYAGGTNSFYGSTNSGLSLHGSQLIFNNYKSILAYDLTTGAVDTVVTVDTAAGGIFGSLCVGDVVTYACQATPYLSYPEKDLRTVTLAHSHEYSVTGELPTCTQPGRVVYTCQSCGETHTEEVPALGHSWTGSIAFAYDGKSATAEFVCGRDPSHTHAMAAEITAQVKTPPTCTEKGVTVYTASAVYEGVTLTETREVRDLPAGEHVYGDSVVPPTCADEGFTLHTCQNCGHSVMDTPVPALGHQWDSGRVVQAPTQTESGRMVYTCARCGQTRAEVIPPEDHVHSYTAQLTPPTCTQPGFTAHTCACGSRYTDSETPALGHDWDAGRVTQAPTHDADGERLYTCTRCGETRTESIPAACDGGESCPGRRFTDMPAPGNWAHAGIDFALSNSLFNGISETAFGPGKNMTRAMLVTVLWRLEGKPEPRGTNTFRDVKDSGWYAKAVTWAAENGIVTGVSGGRFDPDGNITREQLASILYRHAAMKGDAVSAEGDLSGFADRSKVAAWAADAVTWAVAEKLVTGSAVKGKLYLEPKGKATRAQVAAILMRYVQNAA